MSKEIISNEEFANGIVVGINLHQQRVIAAHKRKEPIKVGDDIFYLQSGRERLQEVLDKICR